MPGAWTEITSRIAAEEEEPFTISGLVKDTDYDVEVSVGSASFGPKKTVRINRVRTRDQVGDEIIPTSVTLTAGRSHTITWANWQSASPHRIAPTVYTAAGTATLNVEVPAGATVTYTPSAAQNWTADTDTLTWDFTVSDGTNSNTWTVIATLTVAPASDIDLTDKTWVGCAYRNDGTIAVLQGSRTGFGTVRWFDLGTATETATRQLTSTASLAMCGESDGSTIWVLVTGTTVRLIPVTPAGQGTAITIPSLTPTAIVKDDHVHGPYNQDAIPRIARHDGKWWWMRRVSGTYNTDWNLIGWDGTTANPPASYGTLPDSMKIRYTTGGTYSGPHWKGCAGLWSDGTDLRAIIYGERADIFQSDPERVVAIDIPASAGDNNISLKSSPAEWTAHHVEVGGACQAAGETIYVLNTSADRIYAYSQSGTYLGGS